LVHAAVLICIAGEPSKGAHTHTHTHTHTCTHTRTHTHTHTHTHISPMHLSLSKFAAHPHTSGKSPTHLTHTHFNQLLSIAK